MIFLKLQIPGIDEKYMNMGAEGRQKRSMQLLLCLWIACPPEPRVALWMKDSASQLKAKLMLVLQPFAG